MSKFNFLIDSLKEKLADSEGSDESDEKYPDMNFVVGNTSGMDVSADIPSPLDQRIGRMSQIGGEMMEVQLANPATFKIDRPELMNVLNQLGLNITLHADPNIGFTGAYATRGAQVQGYTVVHRYFKRYLEQLAGFKKDKERRQEEQEGFDFDIGYVNVHASTEPIPGLEEQIASDVSLDPFGNAIKDVKSGDGKGKNIYRNKAFMRKLYDYFLDEIFETRRLYPIFSQYSKEFKTTWNRQREQLIDEIFESDSGLVQDIELKQRIRLVQNAATKDRIGNTFKEEINEKELGFEFQTTVTPPNEDGESQEVQVSARAETLAELMQGMTGAPNSIRQIDSFIFELEKDNPSVALELDAQLQRANKMSFDLNSHQISKAREALDEVLKSIWKRDEQTSGGRTLSLESKQDALFSTLNDLNQNEFMEEADNSTVNMAAKKTFSGDEEYYEETENDYLDLFDELIENSRLPLGREIDKESVMFFHVLPAWMQVAGEDEYDDYEGFPEAQFIWDKVVGNGYEGYDDFKRMTEESRSFRLDVIAAVGCAYIWGHFTQFRDDFDISEEDYSTGEDFFSEDNDYTWIEWMNKFGLKVNFESMYGDPGSLLRVWRPKDIAIVCRAINRTAERYSNSWDADYQGDIAKFTIDMEHTASFGVDPWPEMKELIGQQRELAEEGDNSIDPERPLADIVKTYHLTKPGFESSQSHRHGPFARGDKTLYRWLYRMVDEGFTRVGKESDPAVVMFEVGGEYAEEMYVIRVALDMIRLGIKPNDLDPSKVPMDQDYETVEQQLIARFYGMDQSRFNREWAKIESHAFDPLQGLLEAEDFDYTWSGRAALERDMRPAEWNQEEFR